MPSTWTVRDRGSRLGDQGSFRVQVLGDLIIRCSSKGPRLVEAEVHENLPGPHAQGVAQGRCAPSMLVRFGQHALLRDKLAVEAEQPTAPGGCTRS